MPTQAFIAYDFELANRGIFLNVLEEAKEKGAPDLIIHYPGAPGATKNQGSLWEKEVRDPIEKADKFIAFTDLPNANVGYEIGYAFGRGKPVAIYRFGTGDSDWVKHPPLGAHIRHRAQSVKEVHEAIKDNGFITLSAAPKGGDDVTVLCPQKDGDVFFAQVDPTWGWKRPPLSQWVIENLPEQFPAAGCVVWLILPHDEGEKDRDGIENTILAILAGYAKARPDMELHVLRHKNARNVADVKDFEKVFAGNAELKASLTIIQTAWQKKLSARATPPPPPPTAITAATGAAAPLIPPLLCPHGLPPHPHDPFPDTAARFMGRETQLGSGVDAVDGMIERWKNPARLNGGRAIQWIWAHGFGGMGKSWCLQRIRCAAQTAHPEIRALIIDWDKPEWLFPLTGEPRTAVEVFDLIAIRLCQCLPQQDEEVIMPYRQAKAHVAAAAADHRRNRDRFEQHLLAVSTGSATSADSQFIQLLRDEELWHDEPTKRESRLRLLRENRQRYREVFAAWCRESGQIDPAIICPTRELAAGLRTSLSGALQHFPLIVVLDTCEILSDDLDFWLRLLFAPLITECAPLLLLIGSRLRPDIHQPKGSRWGWLPELPGAARRIEDFGESLRFQVLEIEYALDQLQPPVEGDHVRLAEVLHRATLGVPLAVRGLLDLHEAGDDVLERLPETDSDDEPLSESEAVRKAIADVSERWLFNLENKPERAEDLQDIIALALLPVLDPRLMAQLWQPKPPRTRLRELSHKYSLLSDGDLHPTVRSYLRRHWRDENNRPDCLPEVLDRLLRIHDGISALSHPAKPPEQVQHRIATLNLRSWQEGDAIVPELAPMLCLARIYEIEDLTLETLLSELPLNGPIHQEARKLWHRDDGQRPDNKVILPWLRTQRATSTVTWSAEEDAALALLEGISIGDFTTAVPAMATAAFEKLEYALKFFGLEALPLKAAVGEAYFAVGYVLDVNSPSKPGSEFVRTAASAYERAITLHCSESVSQNNVANLYVLFLQQPKLAEQAYHKAIEIDPKFAYPHNGLGDLYQHHLQQPHKAEQAYRKAIELDPKFARPHNGLGDLYQLPLQRPEQAEQAYRKAIELDPNFAHPYNGLGYLYQNHLKQPDKAEEAYRKAIELDPKFASSHYGLGNLYQHHLQQPHKAEQAYRKAIELDPKFASPHYGLGNLYHYYLQQPDKAEEAYHKAIELEPKSAHLHNSLGALYETTDRWAEAVVEFQQAMALDAKSGGGRRGLAWVTLCSAGKLDEARSWAEQAQAMEPEHLGTTLCGLAVEAWEENWDQAQARWVDWVQFLPQDWEWGVWASHNRISALLRRAHAAGRLEAFAAVLSASARPCWQPFVQAVETLLHGHDAATLKDARAAQIYRLLQSPEPPAASATAPQVLPKKKKGKG